MQSITLTKSGAGSSTVRALDFFQNPFNIGLGAVVTNTVTYTVEYCFEDPTNADFNAATVTWYGVTGLSAESTTKSVAFTVPCRGIRVTNAVGSTGSIVVYIQQAGTR
jgi:hypothetical protein